MFGFAQIRRQELLPSEYSHLKEHYCGLCNALRHDYNLPAALLTGWDGRFLALLVNAQITQLPGNGQTQCPATFGFHRRSIVDYGTATRYSAAVCVFLLGEKLEDTIADGSSVEGKVWLANGLKWITQKHVDQAARVLVDLEFPLQKVLELRQKQSQIEASNQQYDFKTVTQPTAKAVSLIFAHTAKLAQIPKNEPPLTSIGLCVGRLVTLLDACEDYTADIKHNQFNALAATLPNNEPVLPLSMQYYQWTQDYLLMQLNEIRLRAENLHVNRYSRLVQNTLYMGLYDATIQTCQKLIINVSGADCDTTQHSCPTCHRALFSRFCPHCGTSRYSILEAS